jgi:hypothetical protein
MDHYFRGYMSYARNQAAQLIPTHTGDSLQKLLANHWPKSLHVAIQAQAALVAQDVLSAAALTVTFFDVALLDAIDATFRKDSSRPCVAWARRAIDSSNFCLDEQKLSMCTAVAKHANGWRPSFDYIGQKPWAQDRDRLIRPYQLWQKYTLTHAIHNVGNHPKLAQALKALLEDLYKRPPDNSPADFRHTIIHSLPSQGEIQQMIDLFARRSLWHRETDQSMSFLDSHTRPAAVLAALGIDNAEQLYQQLINGLINDIETCPLG